MFPCVRLFSLLLLLQTGCIEDITLPRCESVADCDAAAGYRFCHAGYCFKDSVPADDVLPVGGEVQEGCTVALAPVSGDGCCPAGGGNALEGDDDCLRWSVQVGDGEAVRLFSFATDAAEPVAFAAATLRRDESVGTALRVVGIGANGEFRWSVEPGSAQRVLSPVADAAGALLVVTSDAIVRLRRQDGHELGWCPVQTRFPPLPMPAGGCLVITNDGELSFWDGLSEGAESLADLDTPVTHAAPVRDHAGERLYIYDDEGVLHALSAEGVARLTVPLETPAALPLALVEDTVLAIDAEGTLHVVRDGGVVAEEVATVSLGGPCDALLVGADGRVFASAGGETREILVDEQAGPAGDSATPGRVVRLRADGVLTVDGATLRSFTVTESTREPVSEWSYASARAVIDALEEADGGILCSTEGGAVFSIAVGAP